MNGFYDAILGTYVARQKARAEDVVADLSALIAAFNLVATAHQGFELALTPDGWDTSFDVRYGLTGVAGADTITATAPAGPTVADSLRDNQFFFLTPVATNTTAVTLNVGTAEGAVNVKKESGGALAALDAGDFVATVKYMLVYNLSETCYIVIGKTAGGSVGGYSHQFLYGV